MGAPLPQPWTGHRSVVPMDASMVEAIRRGAVVEFSMAPAADAPRMRARLTASTVGPAFYWNQFDAQGRSTGTREVLADEVDDLVHGLVAPELVAGEPIADAVLDSMSAIERTRLASRLSAIMAELLAMPRDGGPAQSLARARLAGEAGALVQRLGGGVTRSEHALVLADIAAGRYNSHDLAELLNIMGDAVWYEAREGMTPESERDAHAAITQWAKLEEAANG